MNYFKAEASFSLKYKKGRIGGSHPDKPENLLKSENKNNSVIKQSPRQLLNLIFSFQF